ncbi:MAG: alpha/beta fold hydrolase [Desulfobacterales bacterium]
MTRFKRRLLIGFGVCLLALAGLGVWFYNVYFSSTITALQRAEAFLFRRMQVAQLSQQGEYRFFFVTNRRPQGTEGPLEDRFGTEREETLKFGFFDVKIEPSLGLGMILNPTEWFQNEEIRLQTVQALDRAAFVAQVQKLVQESPLRALLVVVHGFREAFPSALRKTTFLGHVLDINTPVLLFDWPGNQGSTPGGYRRAQRVAKASGAELARTLELIIRDIRPDKLWLIANSMGAQVAVDAFRLLYEQADLADAETEIADVMLTAPDVDFEEFDTHFQQALKALARKTTIYVSSNDRALVASRLLNRGRRRGESTLSPSQLGSAVRVVDHDPDDEEVTVVDVTPVNRTRNFHNFSLETPEFFDDVFLRLTNEETPRSRLIYPVQAPNGTIYWILTRGR